MTNVVARTVSVVDSHTAGEPTRVVIDGLPDLGDGDIIAKANRFREQHNAYRQGLVLEPRGYDWLVGALLLPPSAAEFAAGVIFFNNVSTLGMCGHGMIGLVETLRFLGRIEPGVHRFETPVGPVSATLHEDFRVSITNVESYRWKANLEINVPHIGRVRGDIAYGGNWFFLSPVDRVEPSLLHDLSTRAKAIRSALDEQKITGENGGLIDHIELVGSLTNREVADARSFVLCPGGEYDRSPCGTGTSAKLACLASDGKLAPGETWRQQSICGGVFEGHYELSHEQLSSGIRILPTVTGRAFVTGEASLRFQSDDPYATGIVMT